MDVRAVVVGDDDIARGVDSAGEFDDRSRDRRLKPIAFAVGNPVRDHQSVFVTRS